MFSISSFPAAAITFEKFHVMKIVKEGIDKVRREKVAKIKVSKKARKVGLKNHNNLIEI
jgi:transposase